MMNGYNSGQVVGEKWISLNCSAWFVMWSYVLWVKKKRHEGCLNCEPRMHLQVVVVVLSMVTVSQGELQPVLMGKGVSLMLCVQVTHFMVMF